MSGNKDKALVLLSGGQDSTTCLFWAIDRFGRSAVSAISFDYGQRHRIELECAEKIAADAGVEYSCLPIDTFSALGGDALTDPQVDIGDDIDTNTGLPNTFVPGRNTWSLASARLITAAIPIAASRRWSRCRKHCGSAWTARYEFMHR